MSKTDSWNVKLRFVDESEMEGDYVVMLGMIPRSNIPMIHTCTALRYKPALTLTS